MQRRTGFSRRGAAGRIAALCALAAAGAALAAVVFRPAAAAADITVPGITTISLPTVTLPLPLPTTTASTTTPPATTTTVASTTTATTTAQTTTGTPSATTTAATSTTATATPAEPDATKHSEAAPATVAGTKRLTNGLVSIPVSGVRAPARLRILAATSPKVVRRTTRALAITVRVVDTRGYVVRGARVTVSGGARATLQRSVAKVSRVDGVASLVVHGRFTIRKAQRVVLAVRAVDPKAPKLAAAAIALRLPTR